MHDVALSAPSRPTNVLQPSLTIIRHLECNQHSFQAVLFREAHSACGHQLLCVLIGLKPFPKICDAVQHEYQFIHYFSHVCVLMQPNSPLQRVQEQAEGWLLGTALLQRPQLLALQQLLIKGLFNQDTQLITVQASKPLHNPGCT